MVYDGQPVHDHFKKIDDDAVMGIMNGKGVSTQDGRPVLLLLPRAGVGLQRRTCERRIAP